jgi:hypothetical protein
MNPASLPVNINLDSVITFIPINIIIAVQILDTLELEMALMQILIGVDLRIIERLHRAS